MKQTVKRVDHNLNEMLYQIGHVRVVVGPIVLVLEYVITQLNVNAGLKKYHIVGKTYLVEYDDQGEDPRVARLRAQQTDGVVGQYSVGLKLTHSNGDVLVNRRQRHVAE